MEPHPGGARADAAGTRPQFAVNPRLALGLIAAIAFLVRLLHVISYEIIPTSDMALFVEIAARKLTLANLFRPEGLSNYPPGYPLFLKPFYLIFEPEAAARAAQIAQAALGAWTCVLLYRLARRTHSRSAGLVAAAIAAFFPHFVFFTSHLMSENLLTPLYFASLLLLLRAGRRPTKWRLYRAGLVCAATVLVRPAAVSLAPAALYAAWRAAPDRRGRWIALAILAAGGLTPLLGWGIRNQIAVGHFVLIAPYGAIQLASGNNPDSTGWGIKPPPIPGGDLWAKAGNARDMALDFVTSDPWGTLYITMWLKWQAFWEMVVPWPLYASNPALYDGEIFFPAISWRVVLFLGLMGALPALRKPGSWVIPACFLSYVAYYMLFVGKPRYRLPAEGFFLAWAGVAVVTLAAKLPRLARARAPAWGAATSLLLACILAQVGYSGAAARASLRSPDTLLAMGDQFPVLTSKPPFSVFGDQWIRLDRSRGRYLRLGFTVFRQGPPRPTPTNGSVRINFYNRAGGLLDWHYNPGYDLGALPADRWITVVLKTHVPPAAVSCQVILTPDKGSPDVLIIDQPILRYYPGNNLMLEFLFPYLKYRE